MKINLLAFAAHPDDVELSCSGTMYKHKQKGYTTGIIDITAGELGTRGTVEIRKKESAKAAELLQLDIRENLGMADGFFDINEENLLKIITTIRHYQPDIILCNAIADRHPDHARAGELVARAAFLSGLIKIASIHNGHKQAPWRPKALYHYIQDNYLTPDLVVDVTAVNDIRNKAIMSYKSQFYDENSTEPETPISSKSFLQYYESRSRVFGRQLGVEFGEGFNRSRYVGVDNLFDLI